MTAPEHDLDQQDNAANQRRLAVHAVRLYEHKSVVAQVPDHGDLRHHLVLAMADAQPCVLQVVNGPPRPHSGDSRQCVHSGESFVVGGGLTAILQHAVRVGDEALPDQLCGRATIEALQAPRMAVVDQMLEAFDDFFLGGVAALEVHDEADLVPSLDCLAHLVLPFRADRSRQPTRKWAATNDQASSIALSAASSLWCESFCLGFAIAVAFQSASPV